MNFNLIDEKEYIIKLNYSHKLIEKDINDIVKELLIIIRKKYNYDIYGFYNVDIYDIPNIVMIIHFKKKDEDNYYIKNIDLKINIHKEDIIIKLDDYMLLNNYKEKIDYNTIYSSNIKKEDVYKFCEHYYINLQ